MKLLSVRCNHCGAPLEVGEEARFVTCQFCKTELRVERTDSAVFTQQIEEIHGHTARMAGDLEVIRLQNDLEALDREWEMERQRYMVTGKHGSKHEPGVFGSLLGGVVVVIFGIVWLTAVAGSGAPGFFPLFGLVVIGIGVVTAFVGFSKANALTAGRARYEGQRQALVRQLAEARGGA